MPSDLERLAAEKYVVLTTFRRDGRAVATPVWASRDGDELVIWAERDSGKVKRIRAGGRVEVQGSDVRGQQTHGAKVSGEARLLDDESSERVRRAIASGYGVVGRLTAFVSRLRGRRRRSIGIAVRLDEVPGGS